MNKKRTERHRAKESELQKAQRLNADQIRHALSRENETEEQQTQRLLAQQNIQSRLRENETENEKKNRQKQDKQGRKSKRNARTDDEITLDNSKRADRRLNETQTFALDVEAQKILFFREIDEIMDSICVICQRRFYKEGI